MLIVIFPYSIVDPIVKIYKHPLFIDEHANSPCKQDKNFYIQLYLCYLMID